MIEWAKNSEGSVRHGRLVVPSGTNSSCYRSVYLPLVQFGDEKLPKVVLISGVHGDEYEGPAILNRLIGTLASDQLKYCVTVVPCANPLAFAGGTRHTPEDSANLASSFVRGTTLGVTQQIGRRLEDLVFRGARIVIDLHAGGISFFYTACAVVHKGVGPLPPNVIRNIAARLGVSVGIEKSFGNAENFIASAAFRSGASYLAMELGGGGCLNVKTARSVRESLDRYLTTEFDKIDEAAQPFRWLESASRDHYLFSEVDGLFEPNFALGDRVKRGDCAGWMHQPDARAGQVVPVDFAATGEVVGFRHFAHAKRGDCLVETAETVRV